MSVLAKKRFTINHVPNSIDDWERISAHIPLFGLRIHLVPFSIEG